MPKMRVHPTHPITATAHQRTPFRIQLPLDRSGINRKPFAPPDVSLARSPMFRKQDTKIHFVGIGGMGMCGIAEVLINLGYKVTGSDLRQTEITRHLASIGGTVHAAHRPENVGDADVVVISSAIRGYNPEIEAA